MAEKKVMKQTVPKELSANVFKTFNRMTAENKRASTLRIVESLSKSPKGFIDRQGNFVIMGIISKKWTIMYIAYEFLKEHWGDLIIQYPKPSIGINPPPCDPMGNNSPIAILKAKEQMFLIKRISTFLNDFKGELKLTTLSNGISYIPIVDGMMNIITMDM